MLLENALPLVQYQGLNTDKAVALGSTLAVTGAATMASTLAVTGALTAASVSNTGAVTAKSGTAVPATAGAVAAGAPVVANSNGMTIEWTTDAPTHARPKGSVCLNLGGSSGSTRMYIATDASGTWTAVTTAA